MLGIRSRLKALRIYFFGKTLKEKEAEAVVERERVRVLNAKTNTSIRKAIDSEIKHMERCFADMRSQLQFLKNIHPEQGEAYILKQIELRGEQMSALKAAIDKHESWVDNWMPNLILEEDVKASE